MIVDFLLGALIGGGAVFAWHRHQQTARRLRYRENDVADTANQLRFVERADLFADRPVNKEAFKVFQALEVHLGGKKQKWRLFAEVGLGAFVRTSVESGSRAQRWRAFRSYGGKRVDFLIIDPWGYPAVAIEYHGSGHEKSDDAAARDVVKKRALQRAGVELLEIYTYSEREEFLAQLDAMLLRHSQKPRAQGRAASSRDVDPTLH